VGVGGIWWAASRSDAQDALEEALVQCSSGKKILVVNTASRTPIGAGLNHYISLESRAAGGIHMQCSNPCMREGRPVGSGIEPLGGDGVFENVTFASDWSITIF
jgi:hypothetical protein